MFIIRAGRLLQKRLFEGCLFEHGRIDGTGRLIDDFSINSRE